MPNRNRYARRRRRRELLPKLIAAGCGVIILTCAVTIVLLLTGRNRVTHDAQAMADLSKSESRALTLDSAPAAQPTPVPTAEPPVEPTIEPTVEPTVEPTAEPTAEPVEHYAYLPVVRTGIKSDNRIAITVDDCFQLENLRTIVNVAASNGAKLTLFPIGKNVVRDGMAEILRDCVFNKGFEIENHTWSHSRVFRLPQQQMAEEIWKQGAAVSAVLGVNYQQHFFRLMGGDGWKDQRTHNYLKQLGILGIADWAVSGSDVSMSTIKESLAPGNIYLFHTTDSDTEKLKEFIPYAVSQGYNLVTLNGLFDLPDNEMTDLSTLSREMPAPEDYVEDYLEMKKGDYSWSVVRIQQRLCELGFLKASAGVNGNAADGVFGPGTVEALRKYQASVGLPATGVADKETQRRLLES